jgi:hypothetical protein
MECDSVRIHARLQVCGLKLEECRRSCRDRLCAPVRSQFARRFWLQTATKKARGAMRIIWERNISCRKNEL